jgi:hypothetical protein
MDVLGFILITTMLVGLGILIRMKTPSGKKWLASL